MDQSFGGDQQIDVPTQVVILRGSLHGLCQGSFEEAQTYASLLDRDLQSLDTIYQEYPHLHENRVLFQNISTQEPFGVVLSESCTVVQVFSLKRVG